MKTFKTLVLAGLLSMASYAWAANEIGINPGAIGHRSDIGTVHQSTGATRTEETRQVATNEIGELKVTGERTETILSTGIGAAGIFAVGNTSNAFTVNPASWTGTIGCRGLQDNCNVVRLADLVNPVYVKKIHWNPTQIGILSGPMFGLTRIRMFDTRGTTGTNNTPLNMFFDQARSSNTVVEVGHWCSSGTTILKSGEGDVLVEVGRQYR